LDIWELGIDCEKEEEWQPNCDLEVKEEGGKLHFMTLEPKTVDLGRYLDAIFPTNVASLVLPPS